MLTRLAIANLALIRQADVAFAPGFTVLTGETGAGKSLLLDALGLALGERAESGFLRPGTSACDVTATFEVQQTPELQQILEEQGLAPEPSSLTPNASSLTPVELTLRRQLKPEADNPEKTKLNSRAWLNGTPVPAGVLAQLATHVLDIHGQHATQQLFRPAGQRDLLDELAGLLPQRQAVTTGFRQWQTLYRQWQTATAQLAEAEKNAETNAAWQTELEELNYQPDEESTLAEQRHHAATSHQLQQAHAGADDALNATLAALRQACRALQSACKYDEATGPYADKSAELLTQLEDLGHDFARHVSAREAAQLNLESIDDRLHALRAAARKHRVDVGQLADVLQNLQSGSHNLSALATQTDNLNKQTKIALQALQTAAAALTTGRAQRYPALENSLTEALKDLHLPHARLVIRTTPAPAEEGPGAAGNESVELLFTANPGQPPQALGKVASGGELSRAMLALKTVLFQALSPRTVVLDEVDTGLSGPTAAAIGRAMAKLAARHQVLAVTHHPQVAAAATHHLFIAKQVANHQTNEGAKPANTISSPHSGPALATSNLALAAPGHTETLVYSLLETARTEEIARLLAGAHITPQARAAAAALLNENKELGLHHAA